MCTLYSDHEQTLRKPQQIVIQDCGSTGEKLEKESERVTVVYMHLPPNQYGQSLGLKQQKHLPSWAGCMIFKSLKAHVYMAFMALWRMLPKSTPSAHPLSARMYQTQKQPTSPPPPPPLAQAAKTGILCMGGGGGRCP